MKYKVTFLYESGIEIKSKNFVMENGALWFIRAAPKLAAKVRIEKLDSGERITLEITDKDEQTPQFVQDAAKFLGVENA